MYHCVLIDPRSYNHVDREFGRIAKVWRRLELQSRTRQWLDQGVKENSIACCQWHYGEFFLQTQRVCSLFRGRLSSWVLFSPTAVVVAACNKDTMEDKDWDRQLESVSYSGALGIRRPEE
jgi:hypothetical protein